MDDQLTDQQRADQALTWLRENGLYLVGGLLLGLAALFGWRQWEARQLARAEQASALYAELMTAVRVDRTARAEELAGQITREFSASPYADQARLTMARIKIEASRPDEAQGYLRDVIAGTSSVEIAHVARVRLARLLIHEGKHQEALDALVVPVESAFAPRYHEVRGDAYYEMGRLDEARKEYEAALQDAENALIDQGFVQAKLDALGTGAAVADAPAVPPAP